MTHSTGGTNPREYGHLLYGSNDPEKAENVAVLLVTEGLAKVRDNCNDAILKEAQVTIFYSSLQKPLTTALSTSVAKFNF